MKPLFYILLVWLSFGAYGSKRAVDERARAAELGNYLLREKGEFEKREQQEKNTAAELDKMNAAQNRVRERIEELVTTRQEMEMALSNLSLEHDKQSQLEKRQRQRLYLLLRVVYRIQRDGLLRFIVNGEDLARLGARARIVYHTLRSHSELGQQIQDRAKRLKDAENQISESNQRSLNLIEELQQQEKLLSDLLARKHKLLSTIHRRQVAYRSVVKEHKKISAQVAALFDGLESQRESEPPTVKTTLLMGSLGAPVENGKVIKNFGKSVHNRFKTVTFHKGVEIAADLKAPVFAVDDGIVEFEGWVKGLGNVMILHHGDGLYSLNAHLHKMLRPQGTKVKKGDSIALVGDTGDSEIPSLYFELRKNGKAVDPLAYFTPIQPTGRKVTLNQAEPLSSP